MYHKTPWLVFWSAGGGGCGWCCVQPRTKYPKPHWGSWVGGPVLSFGIIYFKFGIFEMVIFIMDYLSNSISNHNSFLVTNLAEQNCAITSKFVWAQVVCASSPYTENSFSHFNPRVIPFLQCGLVCTCWWTISHILRMSDILSCRHPMAPYACHTIYHIFSWKAVTSKCLFKDTCNDEPPVWCLSW